MMKETENVLKKFKSALDQRDLSVASRKGYYGDLAGGFAPWFEHTNGEAMLPSLITPTDVREYRQHLLTVQRYKTSTINRKLASISVFIDWAIAAGLVETDPTSKVKSLPLVSEGPKYLDRKEQYALMRAIEKDLQLAQQRYPKRWLTRRRDASLVLTMLNTGLRLDEMVKMKLGELHISERKGSVRVFGKGGKQRTVPLNVKAREAMRNWITVRPSVNTEYVWIAVEDQADRSLSNRSIQRVVGRIGQDAGLDNLTPHMLRHTFAKNLVDAGVSLEKVAALLGHSSLNTTKIYVTPNAKDLEKAVETLND